MADKTCPETLNFPIKLVDWLKSSGSLKYPPFERGRHSSEGDLDSLETVLKKLETTIAESVVHTRISVSTVVCIDMQ
jgi:hypothetical protein